MTARPSQGEFGAALRAVDLALVVYKPPDDARNWKPCDYMVWLASQAATWEEQPDQRAPIIARPYWFEVKDITAVDAFPFAELRPSQLQGIREAERVGIPYWLAIYWRRHKHWTISDAAKVLKWRVDAAIAEGMKLATISSDFKAEVPPPKSIKRELLMSRFGVDSSKQQLPSTLKTVLLGEV